MIDPQAPALESAACPLCACERSLPILRTVDNLCGIPGEFQVCRCQECGHLYMNPRPTAATLSRCYPEGYGPHQTPPPVASPPDSNRSVDGLPVSPVPDPWYLRHLPLRRVPGLRTFYHWLVDDRSQPLPVLPENTATTKRPKALELGCSTGQYLSELREAGWDVTGVEPSETASQKARDAGFVVHTGILEDAPLDDATFDCVAFWMVIEHVIEPVQTVQQVLRLLRPNGQLLISLPNAGCWERFFFRANWFAWEPPRHLNHFTSREIRRVLAEAGYVNVRVLHQKNILYIIGSCGILMRRFSLTRSLGDRFLDYPNSPRMAIQLMLSPLAHFLAAINQGGRLTVLAQKPSTSENTTPTKGDSP